MTPTLARITAATSEASGVSVRRILGPDRIGDVVRARWVAMLLARVMTNKSLPEIGRHFGRDHTSVLHATRKAEGLLRTDAEFLALVQRAQTACIGPHADSRLRLAVIDELGRCSDVVVECVARFMGVKIEKDRT